MVIPPNAEYGYLTSNRPGTGDDDIYKFTFKKLDRRPSDAIYFPVKELYVFNRKTLAPISSTSIRSCDNQVYFSDQIGKVDMLTKQNRDCEVVASKTGYREVRKILITKILKKGEIYRDTIWMEPDLKKDEYQAPVADNKIDIKHTVESFPNQERIVGVYVRKPNIGSHVAVSTPKTQPPPIAHSTGHFYLILRSFQTKADAEMYLREIIREIPETEVVGVSAPFRIGIKLSNYQEAQETKKKFVGKYSDCWILH